MGGREGAISCCGPHCRSSLWGVAGGVYTSEKRCAGCYAAVVHRDCGTSAVCADGD